MITPTSLSYWPASDVAAFEHSDGNGGVQPVNLVSGDENTATRHLGSLLSNAATLVLQLAGALTWHFWTLAIECS